MNKSNFCDFCLKICDNNNICPVCEEWKRENNYCEECMDLHLTIHENNPIEERNVDIEFSEKCGESGIF